LSVEKQVFWIKFDCKLFITAWLVWRVIHKNPIIQLFSTRQCLQTYVYNFRVGKYLDGL